MNIFFAYCSQANYLASQIKDVLSREGSIFIIDWKIALDPSLAPFHAIEKVLEVCDRAIILLSADDTRVSVIDDLRTSLHCKIPRDNVVFEAGFFTGHLGRENVFIVQDNITNIPVLITPDFTYSTGEDLLRLNDEILFFIQRSELPSHED